MLNDQTRPVFSFASADEACVWIRHTGRLTGKWEVTRAKSRGEESATARPEPGIDLLADPNPHREYQ
jgi:hypothetical protein